MRVVVDSNIVFSMLLKNNVGFRRVLLDGSVQLFAHNYLFAEILRHKEKLLRYTKHGEVGLYQVLGLVLDRIRFVGAELIAEESWKQASVLCSDVDEKDTAHVALAIDLDALLWTGDKKLMAGLLRKGYGSFFEAPSRDGGGDDVGA